MGAFEYGLLNPVSCLGDWKLCLLSYLVPWAVVGMGAEKVQEEGDGIRCLILGCIPLVEYCVLPFWRKNIREKKGVDGNFFFDVLASYCCPCCVVFQGGHEAGVDGALEISKTLDIMKRGCEGFSPKKEMEQAKEQTKEAAEKAKDASLKKGEAKPDGEKKEEEKKEEPAAVELQPVAKENGESAAAAETTA